jgi:hypothetical protein
MWIVIFGLTCFWMGIAALTAWVCSFPVWPVVVGTGIFALFTVTIAFSLANVARESTVKGE